MRAHSAQVGRPILPRSGAALTRSMRRATVEGYTAVAAGVGALSASATETPEMPRTSVRWAFNGRRRWVRLLAVLGLATVVALLAAPARRGSPERDATSAPRRRRTARGGTGQTSPSTGPCSRPTRRSPAARTSSTAPTPPERMSSVAPMTAQQRSPCSSRSRSTRPPPVTTGGTPSRAADVNGWYNDPVAIHVQWQRPDVGHRQLHDDDVQRARQRERGAVGHVQGQSGQREPPVSLRAEVRRDRPVRYGGAA